eukprot:4764524-Prymnesium_polylepis.1
MPPRSGRETSARIVCAPKHPLQFLILQGGVLSSILFHAKPAGAHEISAPLPLLVSLQEDEAMILEQSV